MQVAAAMAIIVLGLRIKRTIAWLSESSKAIEDIVY